MSAFKEQKCITLEQAVFITFDITGKTTIENIVVSRVIPGSLLKNNWTSHLTTFYPDIITPSLWKRAKIPIEIIEEPVLHIKDKKPFLSPNNDILKIFEEYTFVDILMLNFMYKDLGRPETAFQSLSFLDTFPHKYNILGTHV